MSQREAPANPPRKLPRQERSRFTVEAILTAAERVVAEHGVEGATTNRIAEVAGVSIGSLYQYFPNKAALVQIVRKRTIGAAYGDAFLAAVATGAAKPGDIDVWNPVERVVEPIAANEAIYQERYQVFRDLYERTKSLMARPA